MRETSLVGMPPFGKLEVIEDSLIGKVVAQCSCGSKPFLILAFLLTSGRRTSCGCGKQSGISPKTHGMSHTPIYRLYRGIHARCYNKNHKDYKTYGAKGIEMNDRWLGPRGFINFYADMGERPGDLTIEREDYTKNYGPDNCKWATRTEQANNKSTNRLITYQGKTQNMTQWASEIGLKYMTIYDRKARGWTDEDTLSTPLDTRFKKKF
jgi:hypothetical protein